jgi:hypothetical protein
MRVRTFLQVHFCLRNFIGFWVPMNDRTLMTDSWPPGCCVPAFVAAALKIFGHTIVERRLLAHQIGIKISPGIWNPWNLPIQPDPDLAGLLPSEAEERLPKLLKEYDTPLSFRHIPFRFVTLGLWEGLFGQAHKRGCAVAVGLNNAMLQSEAGRLRHVARILPSIDPRKIMVLDDSFGIPPREMTVYRELLERAVHSVDDGFWIIGTEDSLEFDLAPR